MLGHFFDFVLDLALDWDNVEDYTQYVREEPDVLDVPVYAVESPAVVKQERFVRDLETESPSWDLDSWKDIPTPIFRGGGYSIREIEEIMDQRLDDYSDLGRTLYWAWDYANNLGDDPVSTGEKILSILNPFD